MKKSNSAQIILKNFDLVIGLSYNTKNDLELAFGTSGKKYVTETKFGKSGPT